MLSRLLFSETAGKLPDGSERHPAGGSGRSRRLHVHWFRWVGDDPFSGGSLYSCRCGEVRPSL